MISVLTALGAVWLFFLLLCVGLSATRAEPK
jgi:hypothetical protein